MNRLADDAQRFEAVCLGRRGDPRSCGRFHADMSSASEALARDLEQAEDDARHSWVPPGTVRDLRQKNGLDEGTLKDLAAQVRRLAVQYREGS
jgi:hypothetical protein